MSLARPAVGGETPQQGGSAETGAAGEEPGVGESAPSAESSARSAAEERAKALFRRGVTLFEAGDLERALELFLRSREILPASQNTINAAICLQKLGRYDEALALYEQLLTEFGSDLGERKRAALVPGMETLRRQVGSLWISANVDGLVVVDGRARGTLPLRIPIRVLPGRRSVRVMKSGYRTFERVQNVRVGETARLDAKLEPLTRVGVLRIEDPRHDGSDVVVDGAPVGVSPWEGTVGPGTHVVSTSQGDVGSAPKNVVVVEGQTALVRVKSSALGAIHRIDVDPPTAGLFLDGARIGTGAWSGRLPVGSYAITAEEEGYRTARATLHVQPGEPRQATLRLSLEVDPAHPRWPQPLPGQVVGYAFGGYGFGPTLASGAEQSCGTCADGSWVHGAVVGAGAGYRFPVGLSLELAIGYLRLSSSVARVMPSREQSGLSYALDDSLLVHGAFGAIGVGYRHAFGETFALAGRALSGVAATFASDDMNAELVQGGARMPVVVADDEPIARGASLLVAGDVSVELAVGGFFAAVGMGVLVLPMAGPLLEGRRLAVPLRCDQPGDVGCARSGEALPDERAYGALALALPQLRLGYAF